MPPLHVRSAAFAAARSYAERGWCVIPVPFRSKNPNRKGWEQLRITPESVDQYFNGKPQNVGVLLGQVSDGLVDVDLDHTLALELAPQHLPPTPAIFGRSSKPRSHGIYRVSEPIRTTKYRSKSEGMLVEVRCDGMQTVFPPSTHESGEAIVWEEPHGDPADVEAGQLLDSVRGLADEVLSSLGESRRQRSRVAKDLTAPPVSTAFAVRTACLEAMRRISVRDHRDGSLRLYTYACRTVEFGLDDAAAVDTIRACIAERPFGREWTNEEILARIRDAERRCTRGSALSQDEHGCIALAGRDLATGRIVLSPDRTVPSARAFLLEFYSHPEGQTLFCYGGALWGWQQNRYVEIEDPAIKRQIQNWLHVAVRYQQKANKPPMLLSFPANPKTVNGVLETLRNEVHLESSMEAPCWVPLRSGDPPASELLVGRTQILHLPTMKVIPGSPRLFTTSALDFDHDPEAPTPKAWLSFLMELFGDDDESVAALQDWFGYCLVADTSQQKMLLIVGPRRSGKGTIARVLTQLVGPNNVAGPTTSSLAGPFGLQPLIGKSLAIVSDARFSGEHVSTVVERLLCISGEDSLSIDRKHTTSVTLKLPTRFMFLSNELPKMNDASAALTGRFVILRLTKSFYGKEDHELTARLLAELPGILNWSSEGWRRLRARGHFLQPSSSREVMRDLEDLASPVAAFVRDRCVVGQGHRVAVNDLYLAWKRWCEAVGMTTVTNLATFGRDLLAANATVQRRRSTDQKSFYDGIRLKERSDASPTDC